EDGGLELASDPEEHRPHERRPLGVRGRPLARGAGALERAVECNQHERGHRERDERLEEREAAPHGRVTVARPPPAGSRTLALCPPPSTSSKRAASASPAGCAGARTQQ